MEQTLQAMTHIVQQKVVCKEAEKSSHSMQNGNIHPKQIDILVKWTLPMWIMVKLEIVIKRPDLQALHWREHVDKQKRTLRIMVPHCPNIQII